MQILPKAENAKHIIKAWTDGVQVDDNSIQQLNNIANLPFIYKHIAVMPDVHFGKGATVGSVIPTIGAIIPAAVGVDIGCGMIAVQTTLTASDLPDNLHLLRCAIEKNIPHGRTDNGGANDRGAWHQIPEWIAGRLLRTDLNVRFKDLISGLGGKWYIERAARQLGTLGTGNHFIELCIDENQFVWIMLHSGSRGIGNAIGNYFIELAKKDMERFFINLPDRDLSYFPEGTENFDKYIDAVSWAQEFAQLNRELMRDSLLSVMTDFFLSSGKDFSIKNYAINCHHNYVAKENHFGSNIWVTRKGAVRAREGDLGIIPGSMGAKSFIVRGKGNPQSFHSCSHGAGRVMSRNEAKRLVNLEQHIHDTQGVECRKDESVIDETPSAYKNIDAVMAAQSDLVEIVHTLKQVLCVKG